MVHFSSPTRDDVYERIIITSSVQARRHIARTLDAMHLACADCGVHIATLAPGQRFVDASRAIRRLRIDVDGWEIPPAGLFVIEERTIYLRCVTPMTIVHEYGHAIDCLRGGGVYRSHPSDAIRAAFAAAPACVTPYAACAIDEYWAECVRAFVGANDSFSLWPDVSHAKLARLDPKMYAIVADAFAAYAT